MSHRHIVKNGKPGSRQAHHNREKFNPYRHKDSNEQLHSSIVDTMTSLCCKRCCDTIQWKADFGKYQKKLNERNQVVQPRRCNVCGERKLAIAFHHICQDCAKENVQCAKCQKRPKIAEDGTVIDTEVTTAAHGDDDGEGSEASSSAGSDIEDGHHQANTAADREQKNIDGEAQQDGDESSQKPHYNRKKKIEHVLVKYAFVNEKDSDEEFHPYQGLDIRRLKQYKRRVEHQAKSDRLQGMRERERRSVLRAQAKEKGAACKGDDDDDVFSEEEL